MKIQKYKSNLKPDIEEPRLLCEHLNGTKIDFKNTSIFMLNCKIRYTRQID